MDPNGQPTNRLDPRSKAAWRVQTGLVAAILSALSVAAGIVLFALGAIGAAILVVVLAVSACVVWTWLVPQIRYARWRWEVTDAEVRLQSGLIVIERTVIPMTRIQHVDTSQGPIMGAFGLSEVRVWTAAKQHAIPALADAEAARLRDRIAVLARVTDDGGL